MNIRLAWLDHLKALAIVLVVYGHSYAVEWGIGHWIYAFHLPLFFVISGFLESNKSLSLPLKGFLIKQVQTLLIPYAIFAAIGYFAWVVVLRHVGADSGVETAWYQPILATLYGSGSRDGFHMMPIVLWFLPCLLIAKLLVYGLAKARLSQAWGLMGSVAIAALGFAIPATITLPFEIEDALVAQLFVYLGLSLRQGQWLDRISYPTMIGVGLFFIGSLLAFVNSKIDMRISEYGNPILFLLAASFLSFGLMSVFNQKLTKSFSISSLLSQHTILIFPIHILVFSGFNAVYVYILGWDISMRSQPLVGVVATIVNISLLLIVAPYAKKWLPWIYGAPKKTQLHASTKLIKEKKAVTQR